MRFVCKISKKQSLNLILKALKDLKKSYFAVAGTAQIYY